MDVSAELWGNGEDLGPLAMSVRAAAMFLVMLFIVRLGGARTFAKKSAFDVVVAIVLGAIMSRGVVGASPFWSTVTAGAVIVLIHRVLGWVAVRHRAFDRVINGRMVFLCRDGSVDRRAMGRTTITEEDLMESLRLEMKSDSLAGVRSAHLERNGRISFLLDKRT